MATRKESASKAANARWAGKSKEERSAIMRATAEKRAKISPADLELLAWLRENRNHIDAILNAERVIHTDVCTREAGHFGLCNGLSRQDCARVSPLDAYLAESAMPTDLSAYSDPYRCSICLSPILDLDAPCPTCVESGRLKPIPQAGYGQDIAELQQARESVPKLDPAPVITTEPRISQAINRAPIPPPLPPLRAYVAGETCRNCGRLPELHQDHGGPIGHNHEAQ